MSDNNRIDSNTNPVAASLVAKSPQLLNPGGAPKLPDAAGAEKKLEKVVKGKAKQKKKSFGKKLAETFTPEDMDSVVSYVIWDVLIPAAKDTLSDMVDGVKDMILYGEAYKGSSISKRDKGKSYVSYSSYYNREKERRSGYKQGTSPTRSRRSFNDIVYETKGDAIDVLSHLIDQIVEYDECSVADLYQMSDIPTNYTDNKWGWKDLSRASVMKIREGWIINLPKPEQLD